MDANLLSAKDYQQITQWFQTDLGQSIAYAEKQELAKLLEDYFGYHLVQLGCIGNIEWVASSPIQHKIYCTPWWGKISSKHGVQSAPSQLPLSAKSIDLMVLSHVLEFEPNPEQIIEQVCLSLIPEGHMIIFGFNPYSAWGLQRWLGKKDRWPWQGKFYSIRTLRNWLAKNHCVIDKFHHMCFQLPLQQQKTREKLKIFESIGQTCWPTNGGVYCIIVRKQVASVTPIYLPRQFKRFSIREKRVTEPTASMKI